VLPLFDAQVRRLEEQAGLGRAEPLTMLDAIRGIRDYRIERVNALRLAEAADSELAALLDPELAHDFTRTDTGTPNRDGSNAGGQE
jgi:hypothetical protein